MKNTILIHGISDEEEYYDSRYETLSNSHWFPWITKQLQINDIPTVAVEVPNAYDEKVQEYEVWAKELERFDITSETILVGHSFGTGFVLRWLTENKERHISKLVLIAPWFDPEQEHDSFFEFEIAKDLVERVGKIIVISSLDDSKDVQLGVRKVKENIVTVKFIEFENRGHLTDIKKFPELLNEIIN